MCLAGDGLSLLVALAMSTISAGIATDRTSRNSSEEYFAAKGMDVTIAQKRAGRRPVLSTVDIREEPVECAFFHKTFAFEITAFAAALSTAKGFVSKYFRCYDAFGQRDFR